MFNRFRILLLATTALAPIGSDRAVANPLGAQVAGGSANVQGQGTSTVTVTQQSSSAIINWNTFNIGEGEKTKINMPSASSVQLDRVTGGLGPSQILGSLSSNGRVFLVNPNGILFGAGSKIDAAGFLATTNDIANSDFMAGRYNFSIPGNPTASVVNQGRITAQSGGFAALVAPGVRNTGTITARLGQVTLASGNGFTLDFYGDKLITLGVSNTIAAQVKDVSTGQTLRSLVSNEGKLKANGGTVELTAVAARQVVDSVINNTGVIEANTIGTHNGMIVLGAATAKNKPADAPAQTVQVSGTLSAAGKRKGTTGGTVEVTGENVALAGAIIDASGRSGGGTVLIGGDTGGGNPNPAIASIPQARLQPWPVSTASTITVDAATTIDASAADSGNGGKVVVWADQTTNFAGTILARGGGQSGDGGFVETSGLKQLGYSGTVDAGAPHGKNGTLLLDPQDVTIGSSGAWVVTPIALVTALASNYVLVVTDDTITGNGDITIAQGFSWSTANSLYLAAYRNIIIGNGVTVASTGSGSLNLGAGITTPSGAPWIGNGTGTIIFNGSGTIDFSGSTGYVNFGYNPVGGYTNPTNFIGHVATNGAVPNQFGAYMWVNNVDDLQNIRKNLAGNYALANNIDASATVNWNGGAGFTPVGTSGNPFTGSLVGVGGTVPFITLSATITNLIIRHSASNSSGDYTGLFGYNNGVIADVGLIGGAITGESIVGPLAGYNAGTISQSYAATQVTGLDIVGGLVGYNGGTITRSFAIGTVTATGKLQNLNTYDFGGLVGFNFGNIIQSFATGAVNGIYLDSGGIVGGNLGAITQSYATGAITGYAIVGGLVGEGYYPGINSAVTQSYATGHVTTQVTLPPQPTLTEVGGLAAGDIGNMPASYWDVQTTGQPSSAGGTGLTTAQLKSGLPSGFDSTVWSISAGVNSGYPYLTANPPIAIIIPPLPRLSLVLPPGTRLADTAQTKDYSQVAVGPGTSSISDSVVPQISSISQASNQTQTFFDRFAANQNFQAGYDQVQKAATETAVIAAGTALGAGIGAILGGLTGGAAGSVVPVAGTAVGAVGGVAAGAEAGAMAGAVITGYAVTAYNILISAMQVANGQSETGSANLTSVGVEKLAGESTVAGKSLSSTIPLLGQLTTLTEGIDNMAVGAGEAALQTFFGQ